MRIANRNEINRAGIFGLLYNYTMRRTHALHLVLLLLMPLLLLGLEIVQSGQAEALIVLRQARLARARSQPQQAALALQRVIELQPWRTDLYEQIGALELESKNNGDALAAYEKAHRARALGADGALSLAGLLAGAGRSAEARDLLLEYLSAERFKNDHYPRVVEWLKKLGQPEDTLLALETWLKQDPTSAQALYLKGLYLAASDPARAVLALEQAGVKENRYQAPAAKMLDILSSIAQQGEPGQAEVLIGRGLAGLGEWQAAEAAFEVATARKPELAEGWAFLAEARQNLGKPAALEIERALALAPESTTVQALAAVYWRRQGKPELGLVYFHAIANREPQVAAWQVELGKTLCDLNNPRDALAYFFRATELETGEAENWIELARFSLNYGIEPALVGLPAARKAVSLAPQNAYALDIMGVLLFSQNDLASAERFLQQSLQQDAANADAQLHLGQVYLASGNLEAARPHLDEALRLSPETAVGRLAERLIRQYYPNR